MLLPGGRPVLVYRLPQLPKITGLLLLQELLQASRARRRCCPLRQGIRCIVAALALGRSWPAQRSWALC